MTAERLSITERYGWLRKKDDIPALPPSAGHNARQLVTASQLVADFAHVERSVAELEAKCQQAPATVDNDNDLSSINEIVQKLRGAAQRCEELRDEQKRPHLLAGRVIDTFFKGLEKRVIALQRSMESRAAIFLQKKREAEEARLKSEESRLRELAEKQASVATEAAKAGRPAQAAIYQAAAKETENHADQVGSEKANKRVRTQTGTASLEEKWQFEIIDIADVDLNALRPYLAFADIEKAIRQFIRAGRRDLAGVKIFNSMKVRLR